MYGVQFQEISSISIWIANEGGQPTGAVDKNEKLELIIK